MSEIVAQSDEIAFPYPYFSDSMKLFDSFRPGLFSSQKDGRGVYLKEVLSICLNINIKGLCVMSTADFCNKI